MADKKSKESVLRYLPHGYQPGPHDVLCGRGRKCYFHVGNEHFRATVHSMLPSYSSATSKIEKGNILSLIVQAIRERAVVGGFLKKDENGLWYEVGDFLAREKVSQAFRDALQDKYKSSNAYKKKRREVEQTGRLFDEDLGKSIDMPVTNISIEPISLGSIKPMEFVQAPYHSQKAMPTKQFSFTTNNPIEAISLCSIKQMEVAQIRSQPQTMMPPLQRDSNLADSLYSFLSQRIQNQAWFNAGELEPSPIAEPSVKQSSRATTMSASAIVLSEDRAHLRGRVDDENTTFHSCPDLNLSRQMQTPAYSAGWQKMYASGYHI
jgi:hypothetical protein